MRLAVFLISAALAFDCLVVTPTRAATRICRDIVAVAGEDRSSEQVAKQKALAGWSAEAGRFGPAFVLWRNAFQKSLSCLRLPDGTHRCQAYARPCGVSQVPGTQPPGSVVPALRRRDEQRT